MTAARFIRWGSIALALAMVLAPTAALAKHHDRWDRDDDDDRDDRRPVVIVQERGWGGQFRDAAFHNGYDDGFQKGREDGWNRNGFDPYHHLWYRGASRGYEGYGPHEEYRDIYRDGFLAGYQAGFGAPVAYAPGPVYAPAPVYVPPRRGVHADVHVRW